MRELALALLAFAVATAVGSSRAADFKTGDMVDKETWQKATGLLPPEVLKHYEKGEYANKFVDWPPDKVGQAPDFKAGTDANADKFTLGPEGTILDKATGKQPSYVIGRPFPTIDPQDPAAATKIIWNYFYRTWYYSGNIYTEAQINWMSETGLERRADVHASYAYYDGVPQDELPESNPENFLYRNLVLVTGPADLNGTAALTWRYRDSKRDSTWAYVPAMRRVRETSPANRSDGFLGSDESPDDGPFFDGKVEDFVWKLVGQADYLRFVDEANLRGEAKAKWVEGMGWDTEWPDIPFVGYMDKNWKGIAWAPTGGAALSKRKFWIIEGVPRDRYYLFGKLQLYIDATTYQGAWDRKYGWKDDLLAVHQVLSWNPMPFTRPNGKVDYNEGSNQAYQCIENLKLNRATVSGMKSSPTSPAYSHIKFDPMIFNQSALSRSGK